MKLTTDAEQSTLQKLLSNWRSVVEDNLSEKDDLIPSEEENVKILDIIKLIEAEG